MRILTIFILCSVLLAAQAHAGPDLEPLHPADQFYPGCRLKMASLNGDVLAKLIKADVRLPSNKTRKYVTFNGQLIVTETKTSASTYVLYARFASSGDDVFRIEIPTLKPPFANTKVFDIRAGRDEPFLGHIPMWDSTNNQFLGMLPENRIQQIGVPVMAFFFDLNGKATTNVYYYNLQTQTIVPHPGKEVVVKTDSPTPAVIKTTKRAVLKFRDQAAQQKAVQDLRGAGYEVRVPPPSDDRLWLYVVGPETDFSVLAGLDGDPDFISEQVSGRWQAPASQ